MYLKLQYLKTGLNKFALMIVIKKVTKQLEPLIQFVYYQLAASTLYLEGWSLVLILLAVLVCSTNVKVFLR